MTATQAVAFPRDAWTLAAAKAWLGDHDYTVGTPEHTRNFWKFGQEDPARFDRFATKRIEADRGSINLILGVRANPLTTHELQRLEPATVKTRRAYAIPPRRSLAFGRDVLAIAKPWGSQADLSGDLAPMVEILGPAVRGVWTISAPAWAHDEIRQAARSRGGREQSQTTRRAMRPPQSRPEPETLLLFNPAGYAGSGRPTQLRLDEGWTQPVALFRPRLDDGSRPRLYVSPDAGSAQLLDTKAAAQEGIRVDPGAPRAAAGPAAEWSDAAPAGYRGAEGVIYTMAPGGGCLVETPSRYVLTDLGSVVPSHGGIDFNVRRDYPADVQERQYDRDKNERFKVIEQAQCFAPDLLANTNPDAVNGPPIVADLEGSAVVLGGNSRTMTLERVYELHAEAGDAYRATLRRDAFAFGFTAADVDSLQRPILVRLVELPADPSLQQLRELVRRYNESLTQEMDPTAAMVASSNRIGPNILRTLALIPEGDTFTGYLRSARSRTLVQALIDDAVIDRRNASQFINAQGLLNEDGRQYVARALLGRLIPDPVVLTEIPVATREALAGAVPFIFKAAEVGPLAEDPAWDLVGSFGPAAALWVAMRATGYADLSAYLSQGDIEEDTGPLDRDPDPRVRILVEILETRRGPRQLLQGFRAFARQAELNAQGVGGDLFGHAPGALQTLAQAFGLDVPAEIPKVEPEEAPIPSRGRPWASDDSGFSMSDPLTKKEAATLKKILAHLDKGGDPPAGNIPAYRNVPSFAWAAPTKKAKALSGDEVPALVAKGFLDHLPFASAGDTELDWSFPDGAFLRWHVTRGQRAPNPSPRRGELRQGLEWEELIETAQEVAL